MNDPATDFGQVTDSTKVGQMIPQGSQVSGGDRTHSTEALPSSSLPRIRGSHRRDRRTRPWVIAIPRMTIAAPTGSFQETCSASTITPSATPTTGVR